MAAPVGKRIFDDVQTSTYKMIFKTLKIDLEETQTEKIPEFITQHEGWAGILFSVGNLVSITCLMGTLFTFALIPRLRTIQGKAVMNLIVALMLAKLAFQVNPMFSGNAGCSWAAMVQHYFCLAAFLWTSVLAYDVVDFLRRQTKGKNRRTKLTPYFLFAWMSPLSVLIACATVEYLGNTEFSYGNQGHCGVFGDDALVYSLAIPLVLVTLLNSALHAYAYIYASNTKDERQSRIEAKKNGILRDITGILVKSRNPLRPPCGPREGNQDALDDMATFCKMSYLMSLAWLLGFGAAFTEGHILWAMFAILNSVQGIFICITFIFNKPTRNMLKGKVSRR